MDPLWLNTILMAFTQTLTSGFLRVHPWTINFMSGLVAIVLVLGSGVLLLYPHPIILLRVAALVLRVGVLWAVLNQWLSVTDGFMNSIVWLGLQFGGSTIDYQTFLSPGDLLLLGVRMSANLQFILLDAGTDSIFAWAMWIAYTLSLYVMLAVFGVLALSVMLAVVSFQLVSLFAFVMFPLLTVNFMAFIAEGLIRILAGEALRLGGLAALVSIVIPFTALLGVPSGEPDVQTALTMAIGLGILGYITWKGPVQLGGSAWPGSGVFAMGALIWMGIRRM